ncbi:hypothetical protein [Candidatus Pantoea soli]|uniref:hypothetical protein n=1 Tax=Candidatus Pantoea soli TaxID=3098669 RepID=UPI001645ED02|nr:hypothetical protein [Pantoea soli]
METGFYWVGSSTTEPEVWYWDASRGFYRPMEPIPLSLPRFNSAGFKLLSGKLTPPEEP